GRAIEWAVMEPRSRRLATCRVYHRDTALRWNVDVFDHDIVATRPCHPIDVPRILDLHLRDGQSKPPGTWFAFRSLFQCAGNHPVSMHNAACPLPASTQTVSLTFTDRDTTRGNHSWGEHIRARSKEFLLKGLGKLTENPVMLDIEIGYPGHRCIAFPERDPNVKEGIQ